MTGQLSPAPIDRKFEFLRDALEAAEKRRNGVENKASILLASNAILLTAMASLGFPTLTTNTQPDWSWLEIGLVLISLGSVATSSLCAIRVLARPPRRLRELNIPSSGLNVYFFGRIAQFENAKAYLAAFETLTEQQILEQLTTQAHNLSSILVNRYKWFEWSHRAFILGVLTFIALTLIKVLG